MNETTKKVLLIGVVVVAGAVAIWQGISFAKGPQIEYTAPIGHGTPGQSTKKADREAARKALERKGALPGKEDNQDLLSGGLPAGPK